MKAVRTALRRYLLLNKRILKRLSFILILAAVPVMVAAIGLVSQQQNGVVSVALAAEDPDDPLAAEIIGQLADDDGGIGTGGAEPADSPLGGSPGHGTAGE